MDAWARCGRPDKAHDLLDRLLDVYDATRDERYRPNCVPFATVIHGYSVSNDANKTARATDVFRRMKARDVQPNGVVLNNLLNCYASRPQPDTAGMVEALYSSLEKNHTDWMDSFTFGITLKAVSACRVLFSRSFAPRVFRECCRRGLVTSVVQWQLRQAVPADTYLELLQAGKPAKEEEGGRGRRDVQFVDHADTDRIPVAWRRNVNERVASQARQRRK
jgi:hypothetical protein